MLQCGSPAPADRSPMRSFLTARTTIAATGTESDPHALDDSFENMHLVWLYFFIAFQTVQAEQPMLFKGARQFGQSGQQ